MVALVNRLPQNRYNILHINDKSVVLTTKAFLRFDENGRQYRLQALHGYQHQELTKSIFYSACFSHMTTVHPTESSTFPAFLSNLNLLTYLFVLMDFHESRFRYIII